MTGKPRMAVSRKSENIKSAIASRPVLPSKLSRWINMGRFIVLAGVKKMTLLILLMQLPSGF